MTYISVGRNLFIDVNCLGSWTVADALGVVRKRHLFIGEECGANYGQGTWGFLICRHLHCSCIFSLYLVPMNCGLHNNCVNYINHCYDQYRVFMPLST